MKAALVKKTVVEILQNHFKKTPRKIRRLDGGVTNMVFEVLADGDWYVVRLSEDPCKLPAFIKEQWTVTKAREQKVPTPEILEVSHNAQGTPYMISRKVEGLPATTHPDRLRILKELGRYGAVINSIPTKSFGHIFDWSHNELSRKQSWKEFLEKEMNVGGTFDFFKKQRILSPPKLSRFARQVRALQQWKGNPALNHGDLRLKNVMVDKAGVILSILDWENATSNYAPAWELSLALHDLNYDEKDAFLEGYGMSEARYQKIANAIRTLNILNYGDAIKALVEAKDQHRLARIQARINGAFDLFNID